MADDDKEQLAYSAIRASVVPMRVRRPVTERFWEKVAASDDHNACWEWTGASRSSGYGAFSVSREVGMLRAPVVAYLLANDIPLGRNHGLHVRHTCRNPLCCNPNHLLCGEVERFWSYVVVTPEDPDACWGWSGGTTPDGYGVFTLERGGHEKAHRYSYTLACGAIPAGLLVRHSCDNPPCCNPRHLLVGTDADNAHDRDSRGRGVHWGRRKAS